MPTIMIDTDNNSQELIAAINESLNGELTTDNTATELVEFINNAISSGGSGTFPTNTILPSAIGSLEQGEDIGGMTIADFIKYGINGATKKFSFLHYSDSHPGVNYPYIGSESTVKAAGMVGDPTEEDYDPSLSFAMYTGDGYINSIMTDANNGKHLMIMGNHDATDTFGKNYANMTSALKGFNSQGGVSYGGEDKAYWYKDFLLVGGGKVRLFGTCEYEYFDGDNSGPYTSIISKAQITWMIAKLSELTENDYFIIATHKPPVKYLAISANGQEDMQGRRRMNKFCSSCNSSWQSDNGQSVYAKIVDAYKKREKINTSVTCYGGQNVTIEADWENAKATFLCFLCGHLHGDYHGPVPDCDNLLMLDIDTCTYSRGGYDSDILQQTRTDAGRILINKVTVDLYKRTIRVDRIGAQTAYTRIVGADSNIPETYDPHESGYVYPEVIRDTITFDFNANEVITNTNTEEEQENEER